MFARNVALLENMAKGVGETPEGEQEERGEGS